MPLSSHDSSPSIAVRKTPPVVELVEASPARFVLDMALGRVIVEPDSERFHKNGRGRGEFIYELRYVTLTPGDGAPVGHPGSGSKPTFACNPPGAGNTPEDAHCA